MRPAVLAAAVAAVLLALAFAPPEAPTVRARPAGEAVGGPRLLPPGAIARRARALGPGPRLIAGLRVGRSATLRVAGTRASGRTILVVGCLDGAWCAGSALVTSRDLFLCPPTRVDLWTVPGLRGGPRRGGWRALRRLVSDARPALVVLYTRAGPPGVRGRGPVAAAYARRARAALRAPRPGVAGWVARALPRAAVVEVRPGRSLARHRAALRSIAGLDDDGREG